MPSSPISEDYDRTEAALPPLAALPRHRRHPCRGVSPAPAASSAAASRRCASTPRSSIATAAACAACLRSSPPSPATRGNAPVTASSAASIAPGSTPTGPPRRPWRARARRWAASTASPSASASRRAARCWSARASRRCCPSSLPSPDTVAAAALSAGSLGAFAPPAGVTRLVIARDNDAEGERAAAERLVRRCARTGVDRAGGRARRRRLQRRLGRPRPRSARRAPRAGLPPSGPPCGPVVTLARPEAGWSGSRDERRGERETRSRGHHRPGRSAPSWSIALLHHHQAGERGRSSRIYDTDGDYVGDVFRQPDVLNAGAACLCPAPGRRPPRLGPDPRARCVSARYAPRSVSARPSPLPIIPNAPTLPARKTETGAVRGQIEVPSRRDVRGCHTCSLQQPCGSSGRSAPCGLAQDALRRAVKVADREAGLASNSPPSRVCGTPAPHAGPACRPGAPKPPGTRQPAPSAHRQDAHARNASPHAPVPGRVLPAARLECLLVTRRHPHDPAPGLPRLTTAPGFRTDIGDFPHQLPPKTFQGQVLSAARA